MILKTKQMPVPTPRIVQLAEFLELLDQVGPNWIDFEATGLDMLDPDFRAVGIGLANGKCPEGVYLAIDDYSPALIKALYACKLVGYNIAYDAKVLRRMALDLELDLPWPWVGDTRVLYKLTDNRGYKGQSWTLKVAMKEVLGWEETNEVQLDQWLIDNGHFIKRKDKLVPKKGEMWRAPTEIIGMYCGLDAAATRMLDLACVEALAPFPEALLLYEREFMTLAKLIDEEFWQGLHIDTNQLQRWITDLESTIEQLESVLVYDTEAAPYIAEFNRQQVAALEEKQPPQYTKSGAVTVRYAKWKKKLEEARSTNFFKLTSKPQLRWLFYDRLYRLSEPSKKINWKGEVTTKFNTVTKRAWEIWECSIMDLAGEPVCTIEGKAYPGDEPVFGIDKGVLPKLGLPGEMMYLYNECVKKLGYARAVMDEATNSDRKYVPVGTVPISLNVHGAVTGRSSGGGYAGSSVNFQQQNKDKPYMASFTAPPGHSIIQFDYSALENVIAAELSGDANMYQLYGSGIPNDGHLFFGSQMGPLQDELRKYGYDPMDPKPEAIAETKKKAKKFRNIAKTVVYLCTYLGGAGTLKKNLENSGFLVSLQEAKALIKAYWDVIPGVTEFYKALEREWKANGGWFLSPRSRPMSVPADLAKDLGSRSIQGAGHDILLTCIYHIDRLRTERGVTMRPAIVDLHDETIWYAPDEYAEAAKQVIEDAREVTNKELGCKIPLTGGVEITKDFVPFKCE